MKATIIHINNGVHNISRVETCSSQSEIFADFGVHRPAKTRVAGYTWPCVYIVRGNEENGTAVAFAK